MKFEAFSLSPKILQAIKKQGYETPSPVQQKAIPAILQGKDVLAAAQTGTGKTAAFSLPLSCLSRSTAPGGASGAPEVRLRCDGDTGAAGATTSRAARPMARPPSVRPSPARVIASVP